MDFAEYFRPGLTLAVVGATNNMVKYGYKVFLDLVSAGWRVIPVNPKQPIIDGVQAVASLDEVRPKPDVVVFIVPAAVGLLVLDDVARLGIHKVWFQPGAESDQIKQRVRELRLTAVTDGSCIMVERHRFA